MCAKHTKETKNICLLTSAKFFTPSLINSCLHLNELPSPSLQMPFKDDPLVFSALMTSNTELDNLTTYLQSIIVINALEDVVDKVGIKG